MAFLDRFRSKPGKEPLSAADQWREVEAARADLEKQRTEALAVIADKDSRRHEMILADAPEAEILAFDRQCDEAHIKLEKLENFDAELIRRLKYISEADILAHWAETHNARYKAGLEFAQAFRNSCLALSRLRAAEDQCANGKFTAIARRLSPLPVILDIQLLEPFLRELEAVNDAELHRQSNETDAA
jgi:hypothetical protein